MHLLLRGVILPPAEIGDDLGAMGEGLPCPEPRHAGQGIGIVAGPVHGAGLLLHDPPATAADGAIDIVLQTLRVRLALTQELRLDLGALVADVEMADGIGIPTGDIERPGDLVMIELGEAAHEIMDDRQIGPRRLEDVVLHLVEGGDLIGRIAPEIERSVGIGLGDGQQRQVDLVEIVVFHRPEDIAPGRVERIDAAIALAQP